MISEYLGFDSDFIIIGLAVVVIILMILVIINMVQMKKLKKTYKIFMSGKSGKNLEDTLIKRLNQVDNLLEANSLNEKNIECFDWNISGGDASGQKLPASAITDNVLKGIDRFQTAVVLLHDGADKDSTVEALDIVLKELTENDEIIIDKITENTPVILHISL